MTGRELPSFIEIFVNNGGHAQFDVQYVPNRKRNTIELEIRQDIKSTKGCRLYVGPLTINVQVGSLVSSHQLFSLGVGGVFHSHGAD